MIKFFRKIRYDLMEQNKTGKYFKYAIGEIVLVVIGILIALSINNWNEKNKYKKKELTVLSELQKDLKSNESIIGGCIRYDSNIIASFNIIIDHIQHKRPYTDSLKTHFASLIEWCAYEVNDNTYENVKQTLGLELISNDSVRKKIIYLYEDGYAFGTRNIENDEATLHRTLMLPLFSKLFMVEESENQIDLAIAVPIDYDQLLENNEFLTSLKLSSNKRKQSISTDRKKYIKTTELINIIEKKLKKNQ